jgi:transcriptional regulator with XRE-family HTH domain
MIQAPVNPQQLIAERVAAIRRYKGLTQGQLAEAMQELGVPWQRIIVAKIEGGRRDFLTVEELLALCIALEISPTDLLVPRELKDGDSYRVTPNSTSLAANVREWVRGSDPLFYNFDQEEQPQVPGRVRFARPSRMSDPSAWMTPDRAQDLARRIQDSQQEEDDR